LALTVVARSRRGPALQNEAPALIEPLVTDRALVRAGCGWLLGESGRRVMNWKKRRHGCI